MSLDFDGIARHKAVLLRTPDRIPVRVKVRWEGSLCIPDENGENEEEAVFKMMTYGDHLIVEQACRDYESEDGTRRRHIRYDFNEMRRLMLKRSLLGWSLDVPIERENDWLTKECYERVGRVPAPLIEAFLEGYWRYSEISEDDEEMITRQAMVLFGKNSSGVSDAHEAIHLYCNMTAQWDKFGLKDEDLMNMPYRKYIMLKMMIGFENEAMKRQTSIRQAPTTRIAGKGGRTRPSQGQRIPM